MAGARSRDDRIHGERERKSREIKDGALRLFSTQGYAGTSMDDIAKELGYGKASLYYYFKSKEEIFSAIVFDTIDTLIGDMGNMEGEPIPSIDIIGNVINHFVDEKFESTGFFQVFHQIQTFFSEVESEETRGLMFVRLTHIMDRVTHLISKAQTEGSIIKQDPRLLAGMFMGLIFGVLFFTGGPVIPVHNKEEYKNLVRSIITSGFRPN